MKKQHSLGRHTTYQPFHSKGSQLQQPYPIDLQVSSFDQSLSHTQTKNLERASAASLPGQNMMSSIALVDQKVVINESLYEEQHKDMTYVFDCLCTFNQNEQQSNLMNIKMMDTILFENDFQPKRWIFTDLLGRIQFKDINSITINDVIRAFLVNLNENKKNEFNNDDLIEFLSKNSNRSKICFALNHNKRHFLNIESLSDIKNRFTKGIEALQLYKIPTREFSPYFYYHTVNLKAKPNLTPQVKSHFMTRLSHFAMDMDQTIKNQDFYEEKVPEDVYFRINHSILELSKQIVLRIQTSKPNTIVKSIKITYLIEASNYDPWFIGTDYCHIFKKSTNKYVRNHQSMPKMGKLNTQLTTMESIKHINTSQPALNYHNSQEKIPAVTYLNEITQSDNNDELIELTNNNYITQSDFYKGLAQVGQTFGKDSPSVSFKRPSTINATSRTIHPNQQNLLKEKGRRIVQMFPKYLEKSGNKKQASFLFGQSQPDRIFKDFQRLRFNKESDNSKCTLYKADSSNNISQSNFNQLSQSIFDIHLSDVNTQHQQEDAYELNQKRNPIQRVQSVMNTDNIYMKNDVAMFQHHTTSQFIPTKGKLNEESLNSFIKQSFVDQKSKHEQTIIQGATNSSFEKQGLQLLLMNKDLNGIVVIDKDKVKQSFIDKKLENNRVTEYSPFFNKRKNVNELTERSATLIPAQPNMINQSEQVKSFNQWRHLFDSNSNFFPNQPVINLNTENINASNKVPNRCKTSHSKSKSKQAKGVTALQKLQIKGFEAQFNIAKPKTKNQVPNKVPLNISQNKEPIFTSQYQ